MPSLKNTKRRIVSVKSTQKITRAMKLVSSAKFSRANQALAKAVPSSKAFYNMLCHFLKSCKQEEREVLLNKREEKKSLLVVISTDRGLCGGLNTNLFKLCNNFIKEKKLSGVEIDLALWGKKAGNYGKNSKFHILEKEEKVLDRPKFLFCKNQTKKFFGFIRSGVYDRIYVAYPVFKNAISQQPLVAELLPIAFDVKSEIFSTSSDVSANSSLIEPSREVIAEQMFESYVAGQLFRVLLDGSCSEHASRMTAMDSATSNADKVIKNLTLEYNRARQASITKELIEITSGAEAL